MITVLALFQVFVFLVLSTIHFNWVLGGTWGFDKALPTNEEGKRMLNPTRVDSAIVAVGLLLFAAFYLLKADLVKISVPSYMLTYLGWIISSIFLFRAMGDFKYVGFFKKIKSTDFADLDSNFYSPLCLLLGIMGITIEFFL